MSERQLLTAGEWVMCCVVAFVIGALLAMVLL